jgi:hypothetical protein
VRFLSAKELYAKDIHKEMFPVYGWKWLSRKAVHNWWQTFRWWRRGWDGGAEVAETTVRKYLCCVFWRAGKAMGQLYQCWWWRRNKWFIRCSNITFFTFYIYLWPIYWLTLLHNWQPRHRVRTNPLL